MNAIKVFHFQQQQQQQTITILKLKNFLPNNFLGKFNQMIEMIKQGNSLTSNKKKRKTSIRIYMYINVIHARYILYVLNNWKFN